MKTLIRFTVLAAIAALCAVAPGAAAINRTPPQTDPITGVTIKPGYAVRAGGTVLTNGTSGTVAHFQIMLSNGPGNKIVVFDRAGHILFRATHLATIAFIPGAVRMTGVGLANGRRVNFGLVAVSHPTGDRFGIDWNHGAMLGGAVTSGAVRITEVSL